MPDTLPGDRVLVLLVRVKGQYAYGKLRQLLVLSGHWICPGCIVLVSSGHRIRPGCIVADKCGGCQWQHIDYSYQLQAEGNLVIQSLQWIAGISQATVDSVLTADAPLKYRNEVTYPLGLSSTGQVQAGYYQKGTHKLVNLNQCPVQDSRLDLLLAEVKLDMQGLGWPVYNERRHREQLRHLALRIGRRTGEILLTLVVRNGDLPGVEQQVQAWLQRYPSLVGVCLNYNPDRVAARSASHQCDLWQRNSLPGGTRFFARGVCRVAIPAQTRYFFPSEY